MANRQSTRFLPWVFAWLFAAYYAVTDYQTWAGAWLAGHAVGLIGQQSGIALSERWYWRCWPDAADCGIDNARRRKLAWRAYGALKHFSLIRHDIRPDAIAAARNTLTYGAW